MAVEAGSSVPVWLVHHFLLPWVSFFGFFSFSCFFYYFLYCFFWWWHRGAVQAMFKLVGLVGRVALAAGLWFSYKQCSSAHSDFAFF